MPSVSSVSTRPGATALTVTPRRATSAATAFTPKAQPTAGAPFAIARPTPAQAPWTRATPAWPNPSPALHERAAPREARAERADQDAHAGLQAAIGLGLRQRDRDRG